jgi:hypothetical protein
LVPADGAVRPAKGVSIVLSCTGGLVVGGTSLGEKGREAPKSQSMRKVIEASANMWGRTYFSVCAFLREFDPPRKRSASGRGPPPPFIGSRRGGLHARNVSGFVILSSNLGEQLVAPIAEHCEVWPRAWLSSLGAFGHAWNASSSCGDSGRCGGSCRVCCPLRLTGRSTGGVSDDGLVLNR